ncbi:hypothetical protein AOQ84DRAFT_364989 [Glonium stellatum]|uniref:Uncharacterized protein n=1 Tax=Glonium stellatum TaxID=574774 RepID=A0A8E2EYS6_9PEZI|nr:hypothetical protein AOQ84DRAFT_364989 [Glonium stellatum]
MDVAITHIEEAIKLTSFRVLTPNDEIENERLDIHHELMLVTLSRKLHPAPISENIQKAIDLGTGTGIWAIDFADPYPSAEVIGNDLSPTQPPLCTKRGGWVEFQDQDTTPYSPDGSLTPSHSIHQFHTVTGEAQESKGYNMRPGPYLQQWVINASFTNVTCHKFIMPLAFGVVPAAP